MSKKLTPREKAERLMKLAHDNYETWGDRIVECETLDELEAEFAKTGESVREAVRTAKMVADYAADIKATAW